MAVTLTVAPDTPSTWRGRNGSPPAAGSGRAHRLTVAAVVERGGRFLLVEERVRGAAVINQPAGHVEDGEALLAACVREVLEETAWEFAPEALLGVYQYRPPAQARSYLRFAFCGRLVRRRDRPLDDEILRTLWLGRDELAALDPARRRSPMVLDCVDDYCAGVRHPLSLLRAPGRPGA